VRLHEVVAEAQSRSVAGMLCGIVVAPGLHGDRTVEHPSEPLEREQSFTPYKVYSH
jgi:hypothetical protein